MKQFLGDSAELRTLDHELQSLTVGAFWYMLEEVIRALARLRSQLAVR